MGDDGAFLQSSTPKMRDMQARHASHMLDGRSDEDERFRQEAFFLTCY